jgi:hypothetical protein
LTVGHAAKTFGIVNKATQIDGRPRSDGIASKAIQIDEPRSENFGIATKPFKSTVSRAAKIFGMVDKGNLGV